MYVADTLSHELIREPSYGAPDDMEVLVQNLPATADKLEEFRRVIEDDPVMQCLRRFIQHRWPKHKSAVPPNSQSYWGICDELHEADRLLLFGDRLIVPTLLRSSMLQLIHKGHLGDKYKSRARSSMYWPCMCHDIEETVAKCSICLKYRAANPKVSLVPNSVPGLGWEKVAVHVMTYQGHDYIVVIDFYSKYPEIAMLERKTAAYVILHMKSMFAGHGILSQLVSDTMPFASREFNDFAKEWGIKLTTSSPMYPQSNGQSERAVQTMKNMLKKANAEG